MTYYHHNLVYQILKLKHIPQNQQRILCIRARCQQCSGRYCSILMCYWIPFPLLVSGDVLLTASPYKV